MNLSQAGEDYANTNRSRAEGQENAEVAAGPTRDGRPGFSRECTVFGGVARFAVWRQVFLLTLVEHGYDSWNKLFSACGVFDEELLAIANLQLLTRSELMAAIMTLFRGFSSDSLGSVRKAIECTLFAAWLSETPSAAGTWMSALQSAEAYESYRKDFKIMKILDSTKYKKLSAQDQRVIADVVKIYDICCDHIHPTAAPLPQRFLLNKSKWPVEIQLHPYDKYRGPNYALQFFLIMDTHVQLLYLYGVLLSIKSSATKLPEWVSVLAPIFDAIQVERTKWASRTAQTNRSTPWDRFTVIKPGEA